MTPAGAAIVLAGLLQITGQAAALNNGEVHRVLLFCFAIARYDKELDPQTNASSVFAQWMPH